MGGAAKFFERPMSSMKNPAMGLRPVLQTYELSSNLIKC